MKNHKNRLMALSGATLALVVASTAAVAAAGPRDDDRGFGHGKGRMSMDHKRGLGPAGMRAEMRTEMRAGLRGALEDFQRREVTIQTADGTTAQRVENGIVDSAGESGLEFTLGSGETVMVTIDDDTSVIAFSERTVERGQWSRQRMVPSQVELSAVETGAQVTVWSGSEDGADFAADRIVVHPAEAADTEEAEAAVEEAPAEEAAAPATEA